ncbi:MAG: PD-(D/E)XK nuclease family protein, partial [Planctomycetes bacterium]|nr:PD-(D/E)XK nuclease family protein [Planctomycetota bacterium]
MSRPLPLLERRPHAISLDHLSYSAIRAFQTCPRLFDYRYVQRLPDESVSSSLLFGTSLHRAVEAHFMAIMEGVPPPDLDILLGCFWDGWRAERKPIQFNKGEGLNTIGTLAERMLKVFQASPFARPAGRLIGIEEIRRGSFSSRCPDFVARLDLLIETDEALVVTDFKTARSRWGTAKLLASAPQLFIYHELICDLAAGRPVHLKFAVLTKAKKPVLTEHQVYVTPALLAHTRRTVEATWDAIQKGAFPPNPGPMHCPRCPHQQKCG